MRDIFSSPLWRLFFISLFLPFLSCAPICSSQKLDSTDDSDDPVVKVMEFNIFFGVGEEIVPIHMINRAAPKEWNKRSEKIFDLVAHHQPDLISFLETSAYQTQCIQKSLGGNYAIASFPDSHDTMILFRKQRFHEVERGYKQLLPRTGAFSRAIPRSMVWLTLEDLILGKKINFVGLHADPIKVEDSLSGLVDGILENDLLKHTTIIAGDFNTSYTSNGMQNILSHNFKDSFTEYSQDQGDSDELRKSQPTYVPHPDHIDYILYQAADQMRATTTDWQRLVNESDIQHYSDHFPIMSKIKFETE